MSGTISMKKIVVAISKPKSGLRRGTDSQPERRKNDHPI
jgi:hypothetical protein